MPTTSYNRRYVWLNVTLAGRARVAIDHEIDRVEALEDSPENRYDLAVLRDIGSRLYYMESRPGKTKPPNSGKYEPIMPSDVDLSELGEISSVPLADNSVNAFDVIFKKRDKAKQEPT